MPPLKSLIVLLLATPLAAQIAGSWKLVNPPDLTATIDHSTAGMNFLIRPIARGRLKKTNPAYPHLVIQQQPKEWVIRYDQRAPQHMPSDGTAVDWAREDGEHFQLSAHAEQNDLIQTYQAPDGKRVNRFHLDPGTGVLTLAVTVTSPKLPAPLSYTLSYSRD